MTDSADAERSGSMLGVICHLQCVDKCLDLKIFVLMSSNSSLMSFLK